MPLSPLLTKVDAEFETLYTATVVSQTAFKASTGRFFQGLKIPADTPADGAVDVPDKSRRPDNQPQDWTDFGVTLPATMDFSAQIHESEGPQGPGWILVVDVIEAGKTWTRQKGFGPESRDRDWEEVVLWPV